MSAAPPAATAALPGYAWREVGLGEVESALAEFWEGEGAPVKASLLNLLVYSAEEGSLRRNDAIMAELTRDHACRVLLVEARSEGAKVDPAAWVTAHCHLAGGQRTACSEQIAFLLDGRTPGLVSSTVLSHLVSDLPVVCWWQGSDDDRFSPSLARAINRLVLDTRGLSIRETLNHLQPFVAERRNLHRPFALHDLAWTRTFQVRAALASIADHPQAAALLPQVKSIRVSHAAAAASSAFFLGVWATRALGWEPDSGGRGRWTCAAGDARPVLELRPESDAAPLAVELTAAEGSIRVAPCPTDSSHLRATLETPGHPVAEILVPAPAKEPGQLFSAVLARGGNNRRFTHLLPRFLQFLEMED